VNLGDLAGARTVTVHRSGTSPSRRTRDRVGDRLPATTHTVTGCVLAPAGSSEQTDRGVTVTTSGELYGPYDGDVRADDVVEIDGQRWQALGDPDRWRDPFTGEEIGMRVRLQRVTG
jgi:hypothetical protein